MKALRNFVFLLTGILVCHVTTGSAAEKADASTGVLHLTNTINAQSTFRIFRRRADNNYWDHGHVFARTNGIAFLKAIEGSKPWDGKTDAAAYGSWHAYPPGFTITIDWSRNKKERKTHSVTLCSGNLLFWWGDSYYHVSGSNYVLLDRLFPTNSLGFHKGGH